MLPSLLLAEAAPPAGDASAWIAGFSVFGNAILLFMLLLNKLSGKAERREITGTIADAPEYVTKAEHEKVANERSRNVEKLESQIAKLREHIDECFKDSRNNLETKLTELWKAMEDRRSTEYKLLERVVKLEGERAREA